MIRAKHCYINERGILYIPYKRGPYAQIGPLLFVLFLGFIFAVTGFWWITAAFALMALWVLIYVPAIEIHPHKHLFRSTNNLGLFPSRWEDLPPSKYLSVFGVSLGFAAASEDEYEHSLSSAPAYDSVSTDSGFLQNASDKEIYIFLVTEERERFVLAHYSDRKIALEHARMMAKYMKLDLWNATERTPYWEKAGS